MAGLPKWDYIFICSSTPSPRSIEKLKRVIKGGRKTVLIYLERTEKYIEVMSVYGCEVFVRKVSFNKVELRRLVVLYKLIFWLRFKIFARASRSADVYVDSLDLLAVSQLASIGKAFQFRYEVRDLNAIQIEHAIIPKCIKIIEKLLLNRVTILVLTCEEYYRSYYKNIYKGRHKVVENCPSVDFWKDFSKSPRDDGPFVIGYIGVIRYLKCVYALMDAVNFLRKKDMDIRIMFAGGGEIDKLRNYCDDNEMIDIRGTFDYNKSIKSLYADIDLNFAVYDIAVKNVKYAMPNKFYESILTGVPLMVAEDTYLQKRVNELGIGTSVPFNDSAQMADRIEDAYYNRGWYQGALEKLQSLDETLLFDQTMQIDSAVLG